MGCAKNLGWARTASLVMVATLIAGCAEQNDSGRGELPPTVATATGEDDTGVTNDVDKTVNTETAQSTVGDDHGEDVEGGVGQAVVTVFDDAGNNEDVVVQGGTTNEVHDEDAEHVHNDDGSLTVVQPVMVVDDEAPTDLAITTTPTTTTARDATTTTTVADATTTTTTTVVVAVVPVCGLWLVKLDEFVTETDNGCRTASCVHGRDATGNCLNYWEWMDTIKRECPIVDTSDGLGAMGAGLHNGLLPVPVFPHLVAGSSWIAEIQLVDNRHWLVGGIEKDAFTVNMFAPVGNTSRVWFTPLLVSDDVDGDWAKLFTVPATLDNAFELGVTAFGGGCWAVRFTPS